MKVRDKILSGVFIIWILTVLILSLMNIEFVSYIMFGGLLFFCCISKWITRQNKKLEYQQLKEKVAKQDKLIAEFLETEDGKLLKELNNKMSQYIRVNGGFEEI